MTTRTILLFLIFVLILPKLVFAQPIEAPGTIEKSIEILKEFLKGLPEGIKTAWGESLVVLEKIWQKFKNLLDVYVWPKIKHIFQKIANFLQIEYKKRKPIIEKEFQKEKEEFKEEAPNLGKSLWEKIKELIK